MPTTLTPWRARVAGHDRVPLHRGWEVASSEPSGGETPIAPRDADLDWLPAIVPGTAAAALVRAGRTAEDLDDSEWWFRTRFAAQPVEAAEQIVLELAGIATIADVWLNGVPIATSGSMFVGRAIDVGSHLRDENELQIRCHALGPRLAIPRKPRARWRSRLVRDGNLRWFRTSILGRAPGFAPGPAPVGPWRPVTLERRRGLVVERLDARPSIKSGAGILRLHVAVRPLGAVRVDRADAELVGPSGTHRVTIPLSASPAETARGVFEGSATMRIPGVARWWPWTHGEPVLHDLALSVATTSGPIDIGGGRIGFRTIAAGPGPDHRIDRDGLDLRINDVPVFARGAVWTPPDPIGLAAPTADVDRMLDRFVAGGLNLARIAGTGVYEDAAFHDGCDERGILLWQDALFANLDYPFEEPAFAALVGEEIDQLADRLAGRPSVAIVCGNSEVEQQVSMLGLPQELGRPAFYGDELPARLRQAGSDAITIPSAPSGGDRPFRTDAGVASYFGVGGYRRPLTDARLAAVRFAAECLALANVPDSAITDPLLRAGDDRPGHHDPLATENWKAGVARDVGAEWDFDDVRDHYLGLLWGVDPVALRRTDLDRYLELSRVTTGEVIAAVFGEWRRARSPNRGGIILWWRDLVPGAGWGLLDGRGEPKVAWHYYRRAVQPIAVWLTDEGLNGVAVHVANDGPVALTARLRVSLYADGERLVGESSEPVAVPAWTTIEDDVERMVGRFVDASWSYRFGPPAQDVIVASLELDQPGGDPQLLSQAFFFPAGRPVRREDPAALGLQAAMGPIVDRSTRLRVTSRRLAYGVRIVSPGLEADDDAFAIEPGRSRTVRLRASVEGAAPTGGHVTAINVDGRVDITEAAPR